MSLGISEILKEEKSVAMDHGVWGGVAGAVGGFLLANRMGWGTTGTVAAIAGGHFAGHSAVALIE